MNKPLNDCTPNQPQRWLLGAALDQGDKALVNWQRWRDHVDLDTIDPASYRLLPMVYRNQTNLGQDDPMLKRLKGAFRHTWYKNQIIYRQAEQLLTELQILNTPPLLLKGAALIARFYGEDGVRYMNDIDFMLPRGEYLAAMAIMREQGWRVAHCSPRLLRAYFNKAFKHGFGLTRNKVEVDMHCQLLRFVPQDDQEVWNNCLRLTWRGHEVCMLNDTDQLYHVCVHGMRWNYAYLSWIPDALIILRHPNTDIDWNSLLEKAYAQRTVLHLLRAFAFLTEEYNVPVPADFMQKLNNAHVSKVERLELQTLSQKTSTKLSHVLPRILTLSCRYRHARLGYEGPIAFSAFAWPRFLLTHASIGSRFGSAADVPAVEPQPTQQ